MPVPGANVFLAGEDLTSADRAISCKEITEADVLRLAGDGLRLLSRLAELL